MEGVALAPTYFDARSPSIPVLGRMAAIATLAMAALLVVVGLAAEPFVRAFTESGPAALRLPTGGGRPRSQPSTTVMTTCMPAS